MKKKMVTMLLIGVMAVITACGTASKNDTVSDTTTVETDGNVKKDKSENDTKKDDAEVVSVDDVKFDLRDLLVDGGSTYTTDLSYIFKTPVTSVNNNEHNKYEFNEDLPVHIINETKNYYNDSIDFENSFDIYYDTENNIKYIKNLDTDQITKKEETHISGSMYLYSHFREIFDLPWTLENETDDELIFTIPKDTDLSSLFEKYEISNNQNDPIINLTASYIYSKNGSKLQSISLNFDIDKIDSYGNAYTPHFQFSLIASNLGDTMVEIPEDIINNAVEE